MRRDRASWAGFFVVSATLLAWSCAPDLEVDDGATGAPGGGSASTAGGGGAAGMGGAGGTGIGGLGGGGGGDCVPIQGGPGPVVLVENQPTPLAIAVDETTVYWTTQGTNAGDNAIWKADKACINKPVKLADTGPWRPHAIALYPGDDRVFWADGRDPTNETCTMPTSDDRDRVMRLAKDATPLPAAGDVLRASCAKFQTIAVNGAFVYFARPLAGLVQRIDKEGGSVELVFPDDNMSQPWGIAIDEQDAYWTDNTNDRLLVSDIGMNTYVSFSSNTSSPTAIALDTTTVYWAAGAELVKLDRNQPGAPTTLLAPLNQAENIVLHEEYVYFTDSVSNTVSRVPKGGGTVETIALNQPDATGLAVDDSGVYWTNRTENQIMWTPLP